MTLKPPTAKRVPKVARAGSENWWFVPNSVKCVHAIGRTCPHVGSLATQEAVDGLREKYGSYKELGPGFSITMQLDLIATEILREDRLENTPHAHSARKDYLSPWQFYQRNRREFSVPDVDVIAALHRDPNHRVKNYARRVSDRPIGSKNGDHYYVWTLPSEPVEEGE